MNLLERMLAPLGFTKAPPADPRPPAEMLRMADGYRWEMPDAYVAEKQAKLYAALSWISTAIDRTADIAATGIYSVKQIAGEPGGPDDEDLPNHDFEKRLRRPNPSQSRSEFLRDAFTMYKVTGNLYIHKNAVNEKSPPDELWIVPTQFIKPIPDGQSYVRGYEFTVPGKAPEFIPAWKILHLKTANPTNPFVGLSALQSLALDAYGDLAQQKWNLAFFDKNNAKLPQILAFKHMIANPEWEQMKRERDSEWGGTNRSGVTLLRGVGDTLQLIQATATQEQMEFLEARAFTRAEIFGKLAPGLDSILAINATEANAIAGKATLIEFGVWPVLYQMGEKFAADILPLYGDNLDGEFDDMRQTNRILDLQEQAEYAKYHTVNEVRAEYYDEDPLYLDESQVAALDEDMAQAEENNKLGLQQAQAAQKPAFGKAQDVTKPVTDNPKDKPKKGQQLDPRGLMFAAQIGPATPLPGDATQPPAPPPMPPVVQKEGDAVPDKEAPVKAELEAWEKFALKRLGRGGREFEPVAVKAAAALRIQAALKSAKTPEQVRAIFTREHSTEASELTRLAEAIEKATARL